MSMFARTIIILPVLIGLIIVALFFYPFAEPLLVMNEESSAVADTWGGGHGDTVMWYFGTAIALFGLGMFAWHIFAPIREDVQRRRI